MSVCHRHVARVWFRVLLAGFMMGPTVTLAAGFHFAKVGNSMEKLICAAPRFPSAGS